MLTSALSFPLNLPAVARRGRTISSGAAGRFFGISLCSMADGREYSVVPLTVYADEELSDVAKIVAGGIGAHTNASGACWPGEDAIAAIVKKSVRTVRRGIRELVDRGHVTVQRRARRSAILRFASPMIGQLDGRSSPSMIGQKRPDDRTDSTHDRTDLPPMIGHMVADRTSKNGVNKNVRNERLANEPTNRKNTEAGPSPIGQLLESWRSTPGAPKPPEPIAART